MTPDAELMQSIFTQYGTSIATMCAGTNISSAIVAALIANESGGKTDAKRFEPEVFGDLWEVVMSRRSHYGSIGRADLLKYVAGSVGDDFGEMAERLDGLATSWGLTQIMGYELFDYTAQIPSVQKLATVTGSLQVTLLMAAAFVRRYSLDLKDAGGLADLFRCWNTGRPGGKTFDKNYATNGISRAALYNGVLLAAGAAAPAGEQPA